MHGPVSGEIDIMEFVGRQPDVIRGTVHWGTSSKPHDDGGTLKTPSPYEDFHVYAIEWSSDHIDFYFDNIKYHTFQISDAGSGADNPFQKPQYLLINFALGGSFGREVDDTMLPQQFMIDYVRIYQREK